MNILAINFGGIGDEIFFLPTLISLKKEFPNSKITLALEPRSKSVKDLTDVIDDLFLMHKKVILIWLFRQVEISLLVFYWL